MKAWAIKNKDGGIIVFTVRKSRSGAIAEYSGRYYPWKTAKAQGYRCVRVIITEDK